MDEAAISSQLDTALLTPEEMTKCAVNVAPQCCPALGAPSQPEAYLYCRLVPEQANVKQAARFGVHDVSDAALGACATCILDAATSCQS